MSSPLNQGKLKACFLAKYRKAPMGNLGGLWLLVNIDELTGWCSLLLALAASALSSSVCLHDIAYFFSQVPFRPIECFTSNSKHQKVPVMRLMPYYQQERKRKKKLFPPGIEPGTLRVWGARDNHYTTKTHLVELVQVKQFKNGCWPLSKLHPM